MYTIEDDRCAHVDKFFLILKPVYLLTNQFDDEFTRHQSIYKLYFVQ
jgi:hypothetical protein